MVGGAYCPLSPKDPPQRLKALVHQTHSRLTLIHFITKPLFDTDTATVDIETVNNFNDWCIKIDMQQLSNLPITTEHIVFTIFTSGSTGIPKAVS